MNYKRQYDLLIEKARNRCSVDGYKERHHIVPRCMGGGDEPSNLVELTVREHYVAHRLLYMHYRTIELGYAWKAMALISPNGKRQLTSRQYQSIKEELRGKPRSPEHIKKLADSRRGKKHTDETRKKIAESNRLNPRVKNHSNDTRKKMSEALSGKTFTEEHRKKISDGLKNYLKNNPRQYNKEIAEKRANSNRGKKRSEETRRRMSEALKKYWRTKNENRTP